MKKKLYHLKCISLKNTTKVSNNIYSMLFCYTIKNSFIIIVDHKTSFFKPVEKKLTKFNCNPVIKKLLH